MNWLAVHCCFVTFLSQIGCLLRNKKLIELCTWMIVDCVCKQTFQCHLQHSVPKKSLPHGECKLQVCVDMTWRVVAFDMISCTLGD